MQPDRLLALLKKTEIQSNMRKLLPLLALAMSACASNSPSGEHEQQLLWVEHADPQKDAQQALANNDFRLLGMALRQIVLPGIEPAKMRDYELKCGVRLVQGVSDMVHSDEHLRLINKAQQYAAQYNTVIKSRCQP